MNQIRYAKLFARPLAIGLAILFCADLSLATLLAYPSDVTVGTVLIRVMEEAEVPALQEGPVTSIATSEGQQVKPGDILIQVDQQRAKLKVVQAESELAIAKKKSEDRSEIVLAQTELRLAEASLQRALESRKRLPDTPSQAEVDDILLRIARANQHLEKATHENELAGLAYKSAQSQVAMAEFELDSHQIRSPIRGVVVEMTARTGEWVKPGQSLVRVLRIDKLRAEGFMTAEQAKVGRVGKSMSIVLDGDAGTQKKFPGKIVFVSPEVDTNDNRQRFIAEVDNVNEQLAPGARAKMTIHN
jgi:multidrug efflux pump subunit AcrA (membrane-fusion protein)